MRKRKALPVLFLAFWTAILSFSGSGLTADCAALNEPFLAGTILCRESENGEIPPPDGQNPLRGKIYSAGSSQDEGKYIALTFDDGPHPTLTPEILSILREYEIPATFFVIGVNAEQSPELVEREFAEGHEVAAHTYSHGAMKNMSEERLLDEMRREAELLAPLCGGLPPKLFRPPGGVCTDCVRAAATEMGYSLILWSIDTRDWAHNPTGEIVRQVLARAKPGSIILMHDYISGGSPTPDALRQIIPALLEKGYRFVTVSRLLSTVA